MLFACLPGQADNEVVRDRRRIIFVLAATLAFPRGAFPQGPEKTYTPPPPEARVDINHATVADLLKVPGMTPTWAERIVRFRPYRTKIDLIDRGVVTSAVYDRIKDYVIAHRNEQ